MTEILPLEHLGRRIIVSGPSCTGKSTLAAALGRQLGIPVIHLDQFRFAPHTDWVQRPAAEFLALHDAAILGDEWVMEGNYSLALTQRLERASGIILTRGNRWMSLIRYFRRTLFERGRAGSLEGTRDSIKWNMIEWILFRSPGSQRRYRAKLAASELPMLEVRGMSRMNALYAAWGLTRG